MAQVGDKPSYPQEKQPYKHRSLIRTAACILQLHIKSKPPPHSKVELNILRSCPRLQEKYFRIYLEVKEREENNINLRVRCFQKFARSTSEQCYFLLLHSALQFGEELPKRIEDFSMEQTNNPLSKGTIRGTKAWGKKHCCPVEQGYLTVDNSTPLDRFRWPDTAAHR